jgi:hypothetical protein
MRFWDFHRHYTGGVDMANLILQRIADWLMTGKVKTVLHAKGTDTGDTELEVESPDYPHLKVAIAEGADIVDVNIPSTDSVGVTRNSLNVISYPHIYIGGVWRRFTGNNEWTLLAEATRTGSGASSLQYNFNARGLLLVMNITARTVLTAPSAQISIQTSIGPTIDAYYSETFDPTIGVHLFLVYPGLAGAVIGSYGNFHMLIPAVIPYQSYVYIEYHADFTDLTYSLYGAYIL